VADAARRCGAALAIAPRWPPLADALAQAVRVRPREPIFRDLYATCLEAHGQWREAVDQRRAALTNATDRPELLNNLAWLLATVPVEELRQPAEAVAPARQGCELTRGAEPAFLGTPAAALAAAGPCAAAGHTARAALRLGWRANWMGSGTCLPHVLALYRSGRSYRMPAP